MTYLELSGCDEIDGWFPQTVTVLELPDDAVLEPANNFPGSKSFQLDLMRNADDKKILTVTLQYPVVRFDEFLAEGKGILGTDDDYDPELVVLVAMVRRIQTLTGVEYVCCNQL